MVAHVQVHLHALVITLTQGMIAQEVRECHHYSFIFHYFHLQGSVQLIIAMDVALVSLMSLKNHQLHPASK